MESNEPVPHFPYTDLTDQFTVASAGFDVGANPFPGKHPRSEEEFSDSNMDEFAMQGNPFKKLPPRKLRRSKEKKSAKEVISMDKIEADLKAVARKGLSKDVSKALDWLGEDFSDVDVAEQRAIMERISQAKHGFNVILSKPISFIYNQSSAPKVHSDHQDHDTVMESSPFDCPTDTMPVESLALESRKPTTIRIYKTPYKVPDSSTTRVKGLDEIKWCDYCGNRGGHSSKECPESYTRIGKCLNCGKIDSHYTTKCPQKCRNCAGSHHVGICPLPLRKSLHDV